MNQLDVSESMRVAQAARQLAHDERGHVHGKRDPLFRAPVPHRAQILSVDEIHPKIDLAAHLPGVEDRNQVFMRQLHDHLRLVPKPLQVLLVGQVGQDGLDHTDPGLRVVTANGQIKRSHPAARERLGQHVWTEASRKPLHVLITRMEDCLRGENVLCFPFHRRLPRES